MRSVARVPCSLVVTAVLTVAGCVACQRVIAEDASPANAVRVGVFDLSGIVQLDGENATGLAADIWSEVARRLGLRTQFVREKDIPTLIADTAAGRVDVLLGPLAVTESRERQVDFTHPLMTSGMRIAVLEKKRSEWLDAVASLLSKEMLVVAAGVVGLVIVTAHLLWFVERFRNPGAFPTGYREGVWEAIWWSVSTVMTGGCEDKPINTTPGRIIASIWMVGGITLVATLTGSIAATLTAERITGSIHGPLDLAGRTIGVMSEAVSAQSVRSRGGSVIAYPKLSDALDAAASGEVEAVVHENHLLQAIVGRPEYSAFRLVGPVFDTYDFSMAVPPGSPLRERLSTTILAMREDGTLDALMEKVFGKHD
jgi:ABC-type amino acid transport substrate-binding protein